MQAGWFHGSPRPGDKGPAVILSHVDSYRTGPAVFYRLGSLRPHDTVRVTGGDGATVGFSVASRARLEKRWGRFTAPAGEETAPVWRLYLVGSALAFDEGRTGVDQILAVRRGRGGPGGALRAPDTEVSWS